MTFHSYRELYLNSSFLSNICIRIALRWIFYISRDVEEYSSSDEEGDQGRSSIAHEWKRDSCERNDIEIDTNIDKHLYEYKHRDTECCIFAEWILHSSCDCKSSKYNRCIESEEYNGSEESEFLHDHREYEIPLNFRKVSEFLDRFPETEPKKSSASNRKEPLFRLIGFIIIIPLFEECYISIEKIINTL